MRSPLLLSCLLASVALAQQRRVPFEFDAGLGLQPDSGSLCVLWALALVLRRRFIP